MNLVLRISKPGDPVLFPELNGKIVHESTLESVGILLGGMTSGRASVGLNIRMPDGNYTLVQITPFIMEAIVSAMRGAEQREKDDLKLN